MLSINLGVLLSRWKLAYADFFMIQLIATRFASIFVLVKLIEDKVSGFDNVDLKMLQDSI